MAHLDRHINLELSKPDKTNKGEYYYEYPRPALTADCVIFGFDGKSLKLLLIERGVEPYKSYWALPGGFMKMDETIVECARRELFEETGVKNVYLEQFRVFSKTDRDPRGRVVTVAFIALVRPSDYRVVGGDDAVSAYWFDISQLPPLAFDHREIVAAARAHLKDMLKIKPVAFSLLDEIFTVDELRKVYEEINETRYDRRNFQRKLVQSDIVEGSPRSACIPQASSSCKNQSMVASSVKFGRNTRFFGLKDKLRQLISPADMSEDNPDNTILSSDSSGRTEREERDEGSTKDLFNF